MVPKKNKNEDNFRNKNKKCEYFDRGYCKHGEKCNYQHPDKICSNPNCFDDKCPSRHPNPCKYGPRCYYHRQNLCYYSHVTIVNDDDKKRILELEKKVINLEKENIKATSIDIAKLVEKKLATFEFQIADLRKAIEERDVNINVLTEKIKYFEKTSAEKDEEIENRLAEIDEKRETATFEKLSDDKIKALEVDIKVHSEKFTEHCLKVLAVKVDEICIGSGYNLIEKEIIEFFQKEEHEDQGAGNEEHDDQGEDKEDREDQDDGKEEHEDQDTTNFMDKTFINPSLGYSCEKCDFVAKNAGGLKTHIKRKHKNYD